MNLRTILRLNLRSLTTRPDTISGFLLDSIDQSQVELCDSEIGLSEAIKSGVESQSAHLIYADWLEEQGDWDGAIAHRLAAEGFHWKVIGRSNFFGLVYGGRSMGMIFFEKKLRELLCWYNTNWDQQICTSRQSDFETAVLKVHNGIWQWRDDRF
ncbi:MAG: hypothetical protein AB8B55_13085 [Mariniblastus sp.]